MLCRDQGATRIASLLADHDVLTHLDLADNHIHSAGGKALGFALEKNDVVQNFSLKLNPIGGIKFDSSLQSCAF